MADKTYHRIAAVRKACTILSILAEAKEPITGNEVAIRVQESQGTVMCHLATLEKRGYAEQVNGGWMLSTRPALLWVHGSIDKFTPPPGKTYKTIDSVEKAIVILEYLGSFGVSTIQSVSGAMGMPPSSAGGYLESLVDAGFVMEMGAHYKLGMRLSVLWARVKSNLEIRRERLDKELEIIQIREGK